MKNANARFWAKVNRRGPEECWLWIGAKTRLARPYGSFWHSPPRGSMHAHRFSYGLANSGLPESMMVLHKCDVRLCVNPAHLFLGTAKTNTMDCMAKGRLRAPVGEAAPGAKLTEIQVFEIRERLRRGEHYKAIAVAFGMGNTAIRNIRSRRTWAHLSEMEAGNGR